MIPAMLSTNQSPIPEELERGYYQAYDSFLFLGQHSQSQLAT